MSRDPESLDADGVAWATLEPVAEDASDAASGRPGLLERGRARLSDSDQIPSLCADATAVQRSGAVHVRNPV